MSLTTTPPANSFWDKHGWASVSTLVGFLLWEITARFFVTSKLFLAAPSQIIAAFIPLWASGELPKHLSTSAMEFVLGYFFAALLGVVIGFFMASFKASKQILQPWVSGLYATPTVALAPLFILWFGVGIFSKVVVIILLVVFPVIINTETGLRQTPHSLIETVKSFGANRRQIFFKVELPSALPFIFAGLRLGIGRGLIGVVVAELFGARSGLGLFIQQSAETFNMPALFAGVLILAFTGIGLTTCFIWIEKNVTPWGQE
jgi:NitT/TauT family transport system permease protein